MKVLDKQKHRKTEKIKNNYRTNNTNNSFIQIKILIQMQTMQIQVLV